MNNRPRRLRGTPVLREMVRETRVSPSSLIYPLFVREGEGIKEEIPSMEGQYRYSVDMLPYVLEETAKAGVPSVDVYKRQSLHIGNRGAKRGLIIKVLPPLAMRLWFF